MKPNNDLLRPARWDDINAIAQLIYDVCEADGDITVATTPAELEHQWKFKGFDPATDACVVEAKDGRLIGYGEFSNENEHAHLGFDIYAHHRAEREDIILSMMKRLEERACEELKLAAPDLRVFIRSTMDGKDGDSKKVHESLGYVPIRYHWRMEIKLDAPPHIAVFPNGVELRPFIKGQHETAVWQATNEAFRDHWGSHDISFEEWSERKMGRADFDPTLWMIAWDGDQVAGFSQNRFRMGVGWIGTLGVRRPWRKHGLGLALLQHSFGEFYKRGMKTIGLGVDASNPTGATRLYQRAGMYVASEFITYDKELRAGKSFEQ
ncbi:MAG: GNAT family N-acetyltransferase [Chloroflexi bacterium]|nr:GNAT family N-acetyltransferase [Chloroflexota bacterium]